MTAKRRQAKPTFDLAGESRMPAPTMGRRAIRTSALIHEKAREVFLQKGYHGTNIEDIAEAAGISRASFYTYFPSKRDVLLSLGAEAYKASDEMWDQVTEQVRKYAGVHDPERTELWVRAYMGHLDEHGGFIVVWGQAGTDDPELRRAGMKARLRSSRRIAEILGIEADGDDDPALVGLALVLMVDRYWYYLETAGLPASRDTAVRILSGIVQARLVQGGLSAE
jgi:AcrR family transcriptional regulator